MTAGGAVDLQASSIPALRKMLSGVFDLAADPMVEAASAGFSARATSAHVLSRMEAPAIRLLRDTDTMLGGLDGFAIVLVAEGSLQGRIGEGRAEALAGDVLVIDLLQTLDVTLHEEGARVETVILWLSRAQILAAVANEHVLHGLALPAPSPAGALVGAGLKTLCEQMEKLSSREFDAVAEGIVALMAKIIAPLLESRAAMAAPLASFVTIRRYIDKHLQSPMLDAAHLAKTFGLRIPI